MKLREPDRIETAFRAGQPIDQAIAQAALSAKKVTELSSSKRAKQAHAQQPAKAAR